MKSLRILLALMIVCSGSRVVSQESHPSWTAQPTLSLGKVFPGSPLDQDADPVRQGFETFAPTVITDFRYEGTALNVTVRLYPPSLNWLALTLGGGVTWFYRSDEVPVMTAQPADDGIARSLIPGDFVAFPVSAGAQAIFPTDRRHEFALYAGIEFAAHFISGDVAVREQIQPGFGISCGFAVKVFEFGIRYQAFSDMRNLGAYGGIRFAPFDL
jgi:hypothetical protein